MNQIARQPAVVSDTTLSAVMSEEADYIENRRRVSKVDGEKLTGLALSGGGIRSATFSLGILQALSRQGFTKHLDYLSTVSGGSYIGSFFGALYLDPQSRTVAGAPPPPTGGTLSPADQAFVDNPLQSGRGRASIAQLREFGRYLTPGGTSDALFGFGLIARNWISLQVVIGLLPLLVFLVLRLAQHEIDDAEGAWKYDFFNVHVPGPQDMTPGGEFPPWLLFALAGIFAIIAAGIAMSYWFSRRDFVPRHFSVRLLFNFPLWAAVAVMALLADGLYDTFARPASACLAYQNDLLKLNDQVIDAIQQCSRVRADFIENIFLVALLASLVIAVAAYVVAALHQKWTEQGKIDAAEAEERVRSRLTRALSRMIEYTIIMGVMAVIALLGQRIAVAWSLFDYHVEDVTYLVQRADTYGAMRLGFGYFWPLLAIAAPALLTVWAHSALRRGRGKGWLARPSGQAALGLSILVLWLGIWAGIAYSVPPGNALLIAAGAVLLALVGQSYCHGFLNLSSLVTLYSTRLKQAYIGASNPEREEQGFETDRIGDHIPMTEYYGEADETSTRAARPVHLINMTAAQTEPDGKSRIVAHDRKGKPFHVSPVGLIHQGEGYGLSARIDIQKSEELTLAGWTAISGAAASTAIGSMTSAGLSILAMMANVRLGYWWRTGMKRWKLWPPASDTVLGYLAEEMRGSFSAGVDRYRWYLTDGGHFENSGVYALLQRRLDFIIVSDNGADPDYRLDDIVRLVQRARTDLGVDISFLSEAELNTKIIDPELRPLFGTYDEIAQAPKRGCGSPCYAALAKIRYDLDGATPLGDTSDGMLLLIKPRLNFTEPPELLAYRNREAGQDFPQQTTLDQFFDEEQWEAYRRFGEHVGTALFAKRKGSWSPADEFAAATIVKAK